MGRSIPQYTDTQELQLDRLTVGREGSLHPCLSHQQESSAYQTSQIPLQYKKVISTLESERLRLDSHHQDLSPHQAVAAVGLMC